MLKRQRKRRVAILSMSFMRNLAFHRAGRSQLRKNSPQFWITASGNFLDIAVLEWCKLFADHNEKHHWKKIVTDKSRFKSDLLAHLSMTDGEFDDYTHNMRIYRDKFLAHLDDLPVMNIPFLEKAKEMVSFYYKYLVSNEGFDHNVADVSKNLSAYYKCCLDDAKRIYERYLLN